MGPIDLLCIAVWAATFMGGPACSAQTQPDDSKAREWKSTREKLERLDKIASDPMLAEASQDFVLSAFVEDAGNDKADWMRHAYTESKELGILGGLQHPSRKTIRTLVSFFVSAVV